MAQPIPLVSYAQNGEDVVLARALRPWDRSGTWVDVGAGHPTYDSVTRLFAGFGWSGVNIEPLQDQFDLLVKERPRDHNVRCAISVEEGDQNLFVAPPDNHGASTLVAEFAQHESDQSWSTQSVTCRRLSSVLADLELKNADFLKIDVEGSELGVIESIDFGKFKARCIVVESTLPNSRTASYFAWEPLLEKAGYSFALFDGLNRFYFHNTEPELGIALSYPACIFDRFVRFVDQDEKDGLRKMLLAASEHAHSVESARTEAETYAKSLEIARDNLEMYTQVLEKRVRELENQVTPHS